MDCIYDMADFADVAYTDGPLDNVNGQPVDPAIFEESNLHDEQAGGSAYGCSNVGNPATLTLQFGAAFGNEPAYIFLKDLSVRPWNLVGFRAGVGPSVGVIAADCEGGMAGNPALTDADKVDKVYTLLCPTSSVNPVVSIYRDVSPSYLCIAELDRKSVV